MPKYTPEEVHTERRKETARRVHTFIQQHIAEKNRPPTLDEIARGCYLSRTTVVRYVDLLEAWGYLTRIPNLSRSIVLSDDGRGL